ncbi:MAG: ABC-F family ATP-binding cassette domain-containing protein, partial [Gammaproteobacteria bacterium]
WLQAYPGTLLIVSHDRDFLDAVVGRVLHVHDRRIDSYAGDFSRFESQRVARLAQQQAANEKLRREAAHVQSFVDRFRAKASKARQAQSRIKWLERLPAIVEQRAETVYDWAFTEPSKLPSPLVVLDDVDAGHRASATAGHRASETAGHGTRRVLADVSLSIRPGARIGILGRNGAGKSTLVRTLAGDLTPLSGTRTAAPDLEVGFFAQLEVDQLEDDDTAINQFARRAGPDIAAWPEQRKRDHLGSFGFRGDRVFDTVRNFSGGERARLSLAILVARRPNLLLLDEPTNHLDHEMRDSLLLALQQFTGAVVLVSHDRGLLGSVCDEFLRVRDGRIEPFDGDLADYARWLAQGTGAASGASAVASTGASTGAAGEASDADASGMTNGDRRER